MLINAYHLYFFRKLLVIILNLMY